MTRRVNVAVIGSVHPGRANLAVTLVPGSPFSSGRHLVDAPSARAGGVDLDDLVALVDSRLFRRRVRVDLGDDDAAFLLLDEHAHAAVEAAGGRVEGLELLGRVELGVRILELLQQATRRLFVERARVHRIDEAIADDRHHLLEEAHSVTRGAFLNDETADENRGGHNGQGEKRLASACHTSLAKGNFKLMALRGRGNDTTPSGRGTPGGRNRDIFRTHCAPKSSS